MSDNSRECENLSDSLDIAGRKDLTTSNDTDEPLNLSDSPHVGGNKMSSSLKERLKRSSRGNFSPLSRSVSSSTFTPVNKLKSSYASVKQTEFGLSSESEMNKNLCSYSKEDIEKCDDRLKLQEIYSVLTKEAAENEEKLRKLKLVQKHHNKNKPDALVALNRKWLTTTQDALRKLYDFSPEPRNISFKDFLLLLQIECDTIEYNPETDTFS